MIFIRIPLQGNDFAGIGVVLAHFDTAHPKSGPGRTFGELGGNALKQVKAIIADREEWLSDIESLLAETWPDLVICGRARNGSEALELIEDHKPDLAFLEVRIPGICGMRVARMVAESCRVVFITTHDHYAVNAFESGAVDYLVKPIDRGRLQKTIERLKKLLATPSYPPPHLSHIVEKIIAELPHPKAQEYLNWIHVHKGDGVRLVPVEEVCYFKSRDKYTLMVTKKSESLIKKPVKELADELDPNKFWRIHRGAIVNVAQIDRVSRSSTGRGTVRLKDRPEILTVSRPYLHIFKQM